MAKPIVEGLDKTKYISIKPRKKTRIFQIYGAMIQRCYNGNARCYHNYGGRGISVCDEWRCSFKSFFKWAMANGYNDNLTIDRIDNNGNYEPSNCRWITRKEQNSNRRGNVFYTINGETKTAGVWAKEFGIPSGTLWKRQKKSSDPKIIFSTKRKEANRYLVHGELMTCKEISEKYGLSLKLIYGRIHKGIVGDALAREKDERRNSVIVFYKGKRYTLSAICKKLGLRLGRIYLRYKRGVRGSKLFEKRNSRLIEFIVEGKTYSTKEAAKIIGIRVETLRWRMYNGKMTNDEVERAIRERSFVK